MNRQKVFFLLFLITVVVLVAVINRPESTPPSSEAPTPPTIHITPPIVSEETDWANQDKPYFEEWLDQLREVGQQTKSTVEFSAVVEEGETMITEVTEAGPGTFHFTKITPGPGPEEGTVSIQTERIAATLDGATQQLAAPRIVMKYGTMSAVSTFSADSSYQMVISAEELESGTRLTGSVVERSEN